jgi:hypothetical protein
LRKTPQIRLKGNRIDCFTAPVSGSNIEKLTVSVSLSKVILLDDGISQKYSNLSHCKYIFAQKTQ